jgi:hypothetical protein
MSKIEINALDNTIEIREFTKKELDQFKKDAETDLIFKAELEAKEAARQAILDKLGLTADEAKLLLG